MIANLLQCDIMLLIIQTILKRAIDLKSKTFLESHLQKVSTITLSKCLRKYITNYFRFCF